MQPEFEIENRSQLVNVIQQYSCTKDSFGISQSRLQDCYAHVARDIQVR